MGKVFTKISVKTEDLYQEGDGGGDVSVPADSAGPGAVRGGPVPGLHGGHRGRGQGAVS